MKKLTASIFSAVLMLSMVFSSSVFAANDATTKASAWESFLGLFSKTTATATTANVQYRGHVQDYGDVPTNGTWVQEDNQLGTTGESKRIEGFKIELTDGNTLPAGTQIRYNVHVENEGWLHDKNDIVNTGSWEKDGAFAGSVAKSQRVEAIEIVLTDANGVKLQGYSVQYMVHGEDYGWSQGWVADGAIAGTEGQSKRLEAIRIKITQLKADLTAYNAALAAVNQADYTTASWTTYQAVVNANKVTEDNSQAAVDTATANITAAQGNLVKVIKVESVSAVNANQVKITFTAPAEISSAANKANYTFVKGTTNNVITLAEVSADQKEVTLTLTTPLTNTAANYTLGVDKVKASTGTDVITKYSGVFSLADTVRPVVGDLVWDDSQTLSFTIDKDIDANNTLSNAKNINAFVAVYDANGIKKFGLSTTGTEAVYTNVTNSTNKKVTVNVAGLAAGNYTLKVIGLQDLAVNLVNPNPTEKAFTIGTDTTAPVVNSITQIGYAGGKGIYSVVFSEKLNATDPTIDLDDVTTASTINSTDRKTFIVQTTSGQGLHKITVKNYKDLAGNAGTATAQMLTFAPSNPQVVSTNFVQTSTGNKVVVKFDRDLVAAATTSNITSGSYTVSNVLTGFTGANYINGGKVSVVDYDNDGTKELVMDAENCWTASGTTALPTGSFTVTLPASIVTDLAGQTSKSTDVSFVVPSGSTATTKVTEFAQKTLTNNGDANYVYVTFDAKVADASALTASNYTLEGKQVFSNPVFTSSAKTEVRLTANAGAIPNDADYTVAVSNNVLDTNGNAIEAYSAAKPLKENVKPYMASAEVTANNTVKVTFNETLATVTPTNATTKDMEVYVNGSKVAISANTLASGNTVATITLTNALSSPSATVVVKTTSDFNAVDANKNAVVTGVEKTAVWNVAADTTSPTGTLTYTKGGSPVTSVKSGDSVVITANFDEALADSPVVQIALAGPNTVALTSMTKVTTTQYTYTWTVGTGDGLETVTLGTGTDLASNVVKTTPVNGSVVTVDNTLPVSGTPTAAGYNPTTGVLTLTTSGATVGEPVDVTKVRFTTSSGTPFAGPLAYYILTDSTGTVTDASTITITLSATDKEAVAAETTLANLGVTTANGLVKDAAGNASTAGAATLNPAATTVVGE